MGQQYEVPHFCKATTTCISRRRMDVGGKCTATTTANCPTCAGPGQLRTGRVAEKEETAAVIHGATLNTNCSRNCTDDVIKFFPGARDPFEACQRLVMYKFSVLAATTTSTVLHGGPPWRSNKLARRPPFLLAGPTRSDHSLAVAAASRM